MGEKTGIEWCDATWNPWIGCQKISLGCLHCYAERYNKQYGWTIGWGITGDRRKTSEVNWKKPVAWDRVAKREGIRKRVFCGSLCDVFEDRPELKAWRGEIWSLIVNTPNLDWLILTKRPENILRMCPTQIMGELDEWIPPNVWIGVSVENQEMADKRIPILAEMPSNVRFLSIEPMLEDIDLTKNFSYYDGWNAPFEWVIVGGESGTGCRPFNVEWARHIVTQLRLCGVPFFMKQLGGWPDKRDKMEEFPEDLRVREWPER